MMDDDIEASLLSSPPNVHEGAFTEMEWLCQTIYAVYLDGGMAGGVARRAANVVGTVAVYLAFVSLVCDPIDWAALWARDDHAVCPDGTANTAPLTSVDCYGNQPIDYTRLAAMSGWCWIITVLVLTYAVYQLLDLVFFVPQMHFAHRYFRDKLKIPMVLTVPWSEVAHRLYDTEGAPLDVLTQTNLITRKANWMVGLYSAGVLDVPLDRLAPSTLCWCVERCIHSACFDAKGRMAHDVRAFPDAAAATMRRMFWVAGGATLVLAPFILIFRVLWLVLEMIDGGRVLPSMLSARGISMPEHYRLRHYSELDHEFAQRMRTLAAPARRLFAHRRYPVMAAVCRAVSMVAAAAVLVLGIMAVVYDDPIVLAELTADRSVGWWLGVLGAVLVMVKPWAYPPLPIEVDAQGPAADGVRAVLFPADQRWNDAHVSTAVAVETLERTYQPRWKLALFELVGVVYVPWALTRVLPHKAGVIVQFVRDNNISDGHGFCSAGYFQGESGGGIDHHSSKLMASVARFNSVYDVNYGGSVYNPGADLDPQAPSILVE